MPGALADKVAIVTGAGRGIGAATARLFCRQGARVVLSSRTLAELEQIAAECRSQGGEALVFPADVSSEQQVQALFDRTLESYGPLDILVNNAAIIEVCDLAELDLETWDRVMAVNVRGPFLCSRAAFRQMIAAGKGGSIINLTSLSGVRGPEKFRGFSSYVASKYSVLGLSEVMAVEGRPHGIRVNSIAPGAVDTAMLKKAAPFLKTSTTPDHVARTVLYLADDQQSGHISGANIEIFSNQ
jgi:NAD(P)-dependent dehydrogenase (short-subunit alcohol dehydrogenase family)